MRNKTKQNKIDINSLLSFKTTRLKTSCMKRNTYIFRYLGDLVIYIENLPFENKHTNNHNFMMKRQHRSKWTIIDIIIHCTHYQHSDWPRAHAYFENSRDFVDKHDYRIICYPIIQRANKFHNSFCIFSIKQWIIKQ